MKIFSAFLLVVLISSCVNGKERTYVGSTPANDVVRSFLGIPFSDSVDFIRWKITLQDNKYILECNYGIGKPNTNGFMEGGEWIRLRGELKTEKNYYNLQNGNKTLVLLQLNASLLHVLDENKHLLAGTGGWSYTLNIDPPSAPDQITIPLKQNVFKDSIAFHGRTPCLQFANIKKGTTCYKLKWLIVLYTDPKTNEPTTYNMNGTAARNNGKTGKWARTTGKDGRVIYQLNSDNSDPLYFLIPDENIMVFTDRYGNLLTGNEDFSFTLNRKW